MKAAKPKTASVVQLPPRSNSKPQKGGKCPVCAKPAGTDTQPFCSKRCANLDLGRWLDGKYAIPSTEDDNDWADGVEVGGEDEEG